MISLTSGIISSSESKHHVVHEKWNVSSIWVYKGCHSAQQLQPPWRASLWALRELRKERTPAIQQPSDGRDHLLSSGLQRTPAIQWPSETTCHPEAFREHLPSSSRETVETTCRPAAIRRQRPLAVQRPLDGTHSPRWAPRKLRMGKHRILAPESWDIDQRNDFSEPGPLHLSKQRKALNFLPWGIWF